MTDEDLITRLNNLFWMLEEEGHYTKANTARFAKDRIKAQAAEIERLAKDKRWIIDERDRTFALMLSRAEKAEAEIERLRGDLAKAVDVLSFASNVDTADWSEALDVRNQARATLAEIKGENQNGQ